MTFEGDRLQSRATMIRKPALKYLTFLLLFITELRSQESIPLPSAACNYYGESTITVAAFAYTNKEAEDIIRSIIGVIGLQPRFEIQAAKIPNAAAVIHNGKRYVLYNPDFVSALNKSAGSKWASVSILAHEIGHHLNGHTLEEGGSRPDIELEADEFSGFVLNKLGATLPQAQVAMKIAADVKASHTHPGKEQRLVAIARGWQNASGKTQKPADPSIQEPAVVTAPEKKPEVLAEKYISKDVYFHSDPQGKYYVTIRNNLVKVDQDELYIVGRLAESNKKGFPFMLHDRYYNYLYVTSKGKILNGKGITVGFLRDH
jgi:hypothetical protein